MTLESFLNGLDEDRKKGGVILSKREIDEMIDRTVVYEYINPDAARIKAEHALKHGLIKLTGNEGKDKVLLGLYDEDVVLETHKGYHHGRLDSYDGNNFHLGGYVRSDTPLDVLSYSKKGSTESERVPQHAVVSIYKMPIKNTDDFYRTRMNHKK